MVHAPHVLPSNSKTTAWADQWHSNNVRPHLMLPLSRNSVEAPSRATISDIVHTFASTREYFETLLESQKAAKEEQKGKWANILENYKNMTLNFTSMNGKSVATSSTIDLKQVFECTTLAKVQSAVTFIMKREGVRQRPPLTLVKS